MANIISPRTTSLIRLTYASRLSMLNILNNQNLAKLEATQRRATSTTSSSKGQAMSISNLDNEGIQHSHTSVVDKNGRKLDLTFEDSQTAFKSKSTLQLLRGYLVFQLCSSSLLVNNQKLLLGVSRKLLGKKLFNLLMKSTFYGHFVAGENPSDIRPNVQGMMKYGVKSILDYSAEEDLESEGSVKEHQSSTSSVTNSKRKLFDPSELQFEKNTKIFINCIDAVADVTNKTGLAALKFTSLIKPQLLLKFSSAIAEYKKNESKLSKDLLAWKNLVNMKDEEFDKLFNQTLVFDTKQEKFSQTELGELRNMISRVDEVAQHALDNNVRVFVDAEQTYFQSAIGQLTVELMRHYNKNSCIVLNTYQNYLKSAFDNLKQDIELSVKEGFYFGAKLVRGAYMEQERQRAKEMGYEDPINENFDATTKMYEKSYLYCLEQIKSNPLGKISIMVASHNEATVRFAVENMMKMNIKPDEQVVFFGQLLGMCDYISFYLGGVGYSVYKYVPYGPVEEVLPYLSRRANENRGIFEKVKKEKRLLLSEIKRRMTSFA